MTAPAAEVVIIDGRNVQRIQVIARCLRCQVTSYNTGTAAAKARAHTDETGHRVVVVTITTDVTEPPDGFPVPVPARWEVAGP
jgi:hypothetical protein